MAAPSSGGPDVLVVVPSSQRADSTICAASLLRWAEGAVGRPPRAYALAGGDLKRELRAAGVKVVESPRQPLRTAEKVLLRLDRDREARAVRKVLHRYLFTKPPHPDVVLAVGLVAAVRAERVVPTGVRLVTYCFDDGPALDRLVDPDTAARLLRRTDAWVAAHGGIARDLVERGVTPDDVVTIPPFVDDPPPHRPGSEALRRSLGLGPDEVLVGGFGRSDWTAGPDVFIRMASVVHRAHPELPVRFVWVGAPDDGPTRWILEHDVTNAGLDGVVTLTGSLDDGETWVGALDVLAVTGRVDALPPPTLHAAVAGVPLVAFDGGATRLLADEVGGSPGVTLVAPLDVAAMAAAVADLAADPGHRSAGSAQVRDGSARRRLATRAAPRLWAAVEAVAAGRPVSAAAGPPPSPRGAAPTGDAPHDPTTQEIRA